MNLTKCIEHRNEYGQPGWLIQFPYDALFLNDDFKDAIDTPYRQWLPELKQWWVSEECGLVLKELFENWSFPITPRKPTVRKIKCLKCGDKQLIPFKRQDGSIVSHAFIDCECKQDEPKHFRQAKPSDFDFAMSHDYWRSLCQYHGWPDPGSCELPEREVEPTRPERKPTEDTFTQLKSEVIGWRKKHAESLLEIDKLRAKVDRSTKKYKQYTNK